MTIWRWSIASRIRSPQASFRFGPAGRIDCAAAALRLRFAKGDVGGDHQAFGRRPPPRRRRRSRCRRWRRRAGSPRSRTRAISRSAAAIAWAGSGAAAASRANSSAQIRAGRSSARGFFAGRVAPTVASSRSPASCPSESLTRWKESMSSSSRRRPTARGRGGRGSALPPLRRTGLDRRDRRCRSLLAPRPPAPGRISLSKRLYKKLGSPCEIGR